MKIKFKNYLLVFFSIISIILIIIFILFFGQENSIFNNHISPIIINHISQKYNFEDYSSENTIELYNLGFGLSFYIDGLKINTDGIINNNTVFHYIIPNKISIQLNNITGRGDFMINFGWKYFGLKDIIFFYIHSSSINIIAFLEPYPLTLNLKYYEKNLNLNVQEFYTFISRAVSSGIFKPLKYLFGINPVDWIFEKCHEKINDIISSIIENKIIESFVNKMINKINIYLQGNKFQFFFDSSLSCLINSYYFLKNFYMKALK